MAAITTQEFEHHFKSLYKPLCLFALRYTDQVDDAEDIVQQAFADVWDKNRAGNVIGNLKAYLYQAVRNRSLSFTSQPVNAEATEQLPDVEDTSEEEDILQSERDARLWDAIDRLPPERKKIFLLSKRDGLKYQEIAEELNLSVSENRLLELRVSLTRVARREPMLSLPSYSTATGVLRSVMRVGLSGMAASVLAGASAAKAGTAGSSRARPKASERR